MGASTAISNVDPISREQSIRSLKSIKSEKIVEVPEQIERPVTPPPVKEEVIVKKDENKVKRLPSKRISFTKHQQGGPTIIESPTFDSKTKLKELKKLMKKKDIKTDLLIAQFFLELTTRQRHILEKEYDQTEKGKNLREQFQN